MAPKDLALPVDQLRLAVGPWLAWFSVKLPGACPAASSTPPWVDIGRFRFRSGFVARRSAEDLPPFRVVDLGVRDTALGRN